jgi:hypothetical protein
MIKEKIRALYRRIRFGIMPSFEKPQYFLNNAKGSSSACFILAGYKPFTWEIVFKRLKKFCPENIDVCIVSSGVYSPELDSYAKKNNWSYLATKRNCVTLALNTAIKAFPKAENIFKLDEDIFLTEGFFDELPRAYEEASRDYYPAFSAPLIPINGFGYRVILEKLNLVDLYTKKFEYPVVSTGAFMQIEGNPDVAKFMWSATGEMPGIDSLNAMFKASCEGTAGYRVCPIRFSIGAIYFKREFIEKVGWFPVYKGNCMGRDEVFLCNLATSQSKAIIVSEKQVVGHLSFGSQNKSMEEYFILHKETFDI